MNESYEYEKRIVVFIDILGFKQHIKMTENYENRKKMFQVMNYIKALQVNNYKKDSFRNLSEIGREITIFSDSIVISYPADLQGGVFYIAMDIIHLQLELAGVEILVRGGIALGDLYHKDNVVFGPAMIEAYELESKYAIYPRVILTKDIINHGVRHHGQANTKNHEIKYLNGILAKDEDGYFYTDFLAQHGELDEINYYYKLLDTLKSNIINGLGINDERINDKYVWLKDYYNRTVKKCLNDEGIKKFTIS